MPGTVKCRNCEKTFRVEVDWPLPTRCPECEADFIKRRDAFDAELAALCEKYQIALIEDEYTLSVITEDTYVRKDEKDLTRLIG